MRWLALLFLVLLLVVGGTLYHSRQGQGARRAAWSAQNREVRKAFGSAVDAVGTEDEQFRLRLNAFDRELDELRLMEKTLPAQEALDLDYDVVTFQNCRLALDDQRVKLASDQPSNFDTTEMIKCR